MTIYCAYCGADNIHSQECITLRPNPPKKCPKCGRDQMRQFKATQWWNCDHCGFAGHDPTNQVAPAVWHLDAENTLDTRHQVVVK